MVVVVIVVIVIYVFVALYTNPVKMYWAMHLCSHHIFSQYSYTNKVVFWVSTVLNGKHMPEVSARKPVPRYWIVPVIQEEGVFGAVTGSCYKSSGEGKVSRPSWKQNFTLTAMEKKQNKESRHLGSHSQNDFAGQMGLPQSW